MNKQTSNSIYEPRQRNLSRLVQSQYWIICGFNQPAVSGQNRDGHLLEK